MAGKSKKEDSTQDVFGENASDASLESFKLTPEHITTILWLVTETESVDEKKKQLGEDFKGAAAKMGLKPADIKEMVSTVIKERAEGGVLIAKEKRLNLTRQLIDGVAEAEDKAPKAQFADDAPAQ